MKNFLIYIYKNSQITAVCSFEPNKSFEKNSIFVHWTTCESFLKIGHNVGKMSYCVNYGNFEQLSRSVLETVA